ncbi:hypothetical protein ACLMAJ_14205 [Nocardia sp. KC 131]|uniref:hypothetical protein n=1 Tax=Nocardia arseniciresistens TaxID=3392119 RepID=UPI00398E87D8
MTPGLELEESLLMNIFRRYSTAVALSGIAAVEGGMASTGTQLDPTSEAIRWQRFESSDLVRRAMAMPPDYEPGARAEYTNTWGHGGSIPGFEVRTGVAADGTAVVVSSNQLPTNREAVDAVERVFDTAICGA